MIIRPVIGEAFLPLYDRHGVGASWRFFVGRGGRGGAKTTAFADYVAIAMASGKETVLCAREHLISMSDSVHAEIVAALDRHGLRGMFIVTDRVIKCPLTGSRCVFRGLSKNLLSLKSMGKLTLVWIEEAASLSSDSWLVLEPTVREADSRFLVSYNPQNPDDFIETLFGPTAEPVEDALVVNCNFEDNPFHHRSSLADSERVLARRSLPQWRHVYRGGLDRNSSALVFDQSSISVDYIDTMGARPMFGADWGASDTDPCVIVKTFYLSPEMLGREPTEAGILYWADAEVAYRIPPTALDRFILGLTNSTDVHIIGDSAGKMLIEMLNGTTSGEGYHGAIFPNLVAAQKGPGSIMAGVRWMQAQEHVVSPDCDNLVLEELTSYSFEVTKAGKVLRWKNPVDAFNHTIDSGRYSCELAISGKAGGVAYI